MTNKDKRLYRDMTIEVEKRAEGAEPTYKVRGYASTFEPYVIYTDPDGIEYYEQIDPNAFDEADMSDCVFRVDHMGLVYARTSSGDLALGTDEHGLFDEADLGKTSSGRSLFEDIAAGHYPKQSFAFTVREDSYDRETRTRTIRKIEKLYDVSPVSFPANPGTELDIATRSYFDGVIKDEEAERLRAAEANRQKELLKLRILLTEVNNK